MKLRAENSSNENKLTKMTSVFLNMRFHFTLTRTRTYMSNLFL
jgi:hypothetical protein